ELSRAQRQVESNRLLAQETLDALPAHVCVLDQEGLVMAVNKAWRESSGVSRILGGGAIEGADYLAACTTTLRSEAGPIALAVSGLRAVIAGDRDSFANGYGGDSAGGRWWCRASVSRFEVERTARFVVTKQNISDRRLAAEQIAEQGPLLRLA